jgi:hypothetical protein
MHARPTKSHGKKIIIPTAFFTGEHRNFRKIQAYPIAHSLPFD